MMRHILTTSTRVDAPIEDVFEFFSDAAHLETLMPPWLRLRVRSPAPVELDVGAEIEYRMRLHGVPFRWVSRITTWSPPRRFVDEQIRGPYRLWIHEHDFVDLGGRTDCRDRVSFQAPGGAWLTERLVLPELERIFAYRRERLTSTFGGWAEGGAIRFERAP